MMKSLLYDSPDRVTEGAALVLLDPVPHDPSVAAVLLAPLTPNAMRPIPSVPVPETATLTIWLDMGDTSDRYQISTWPVEGAKTHLGPFITVEPTLGGLIVSPGCATTMAIIKSPELAVERPVVLIGEYFTVLYTAAGQLDGKVPLLPQSPEGVAATAAGTADSREETTARATSIDTARSPMRDELPTFIA